MKASSSRPSSSPPRSAARASQLTPWDLNSEHPTWSPDSRWIVYDNGPDGHLERVRPNGHRRETILPARARFGAHTPEAMENWPSWGPAPRR